MRIRFGVMDAMEQSIALSNPKTNGSETGESHYGSRHIHDRS